MARQDYWPAREEKFTKVGFSLYPCESNMRFIFLEASEDAPAVIFRSI